MKITWLSVVIVALILLLAIPLAGCTSPSEPKPFPPPEGYSSWDEYYRESQQPPASTPIPSPTPTPTPSPTPSPKYNWEIIDLTYKITEKNPSWWKFSWQAMVKNNTNSVVEFFITVNFLDKEGFIIEDDIANPPEFAPKERRTIKGYALVDTEIASDIKRIELGDVSAYIRD